MSQTVKGGVWTNIEDEILKASISKYGLNQWARVSSLLARKSAKQCKARWESWLDPSIRKTEWSKEEDEKLLHLAKMMPTQWRTLAPLVGRTPQMCLERYQKLLDDAEQRESGELGLTGVGDEAAAPSADTVRRLRPGELDPEPETRPAKPDTIDLDEDEKDMLSEARARLANTQGKKAKRKARERQLEQSRRVAALQKRRELKMSGINIKLKTHKKGEMDYNADIPFEHKPAEGFYDVSEEAEQNEKERDDFDPRKQNLAIKRKGGPQDEEFDNKKRKKDEKGSQSASLAAAMKAGQAQKLREAEQQSKRRALNLPAPQVSEAELDDIVKMGLTGNRASQAAGGGDNAATRGLVGDYSSTIGATPVRTPMAPKEEDRIANELRNIRALNETQSALLGGENTTLVEGAGSTGWAGATPSKHVVATPNPLATPRQTNGVGGPVGPPGPGATPLRTPRDTFSLNKEDGMQLVGQTPRDIKLRQTSMRQSLLNRLASLPKPKETEWELELPEEQQEDTFTARGGEEDAAVRDAREKAQRDAADKADFAKQSQVVQRRLPRPKVVDINALYKQAQHVEDPIRRLAALETANMIANDAARFVGSKVTGRPRQLENIGVNALERARQLVISELSAEQKQRGEFASAWTELHGSPRLPGLEGYYEDEVDEHQLMVEAFDNAQDKIMAMAEKGQELEKKLAKVHGGYQQRSKTLRQKIAEAAEALEKTRIEINTARSAQIGEESAIQSRLEQLRDEVAFVSRREREAQEEYRQAKDELESVGMVNGFH